MVRLLALRDRLPTFGRFHMAGHWDMTGFEFGCAVQRVLARHGGVEPLLRSFPWWQVWLLLAPFVTTLREMLEMRYLWQQEVRMDNPRLLEVLGIEPHTSLDEAIKHTLAGMDCLPEPCVALA